MLNRLRPRRMPRLPGRNFKPEANLFGFRNKGESAFHNVKKLMGFDKMVMNKLSFFYFTGNVFTAFCVFKAYGWMFTIYQRRNEKLFEEERIKDTAKIYNDTNIKLKK
jgi:hypothetical protein